MRPNRASPITAGVALAALGLFALLQSALLAWGSVLGGGFGRACAARELPQGVPLDGSGDGRFSLWPVGVECTFTGTGGSTAVADSWGNTALALVGLALVAGGLLIVTLAAVSSRRPTAAEGW